MSHRNNMVSVTERMLSYYSVAGGGKQINVIQLLNKELIEK
jgi:hypothetical protein